MYDLDKGKSKKLKHFTTIKESDFKEITKEKDSEKLFWKYNEIIIEKMMTALPEGSTLEGIWEQLTVAQKGLFVTAHFIGQTNNGGVWQFFFNKPDYSVAVLQFLYVLKSQPGKAKIPFQLKYDYEKALKEFYGMMDNGKLNEIYDIWNNGELTFEERWAAFNQGYDYITNDRNTIQQYFYKDDFKKDFYKGLNAYIEHNIGLLLKIELENSDKSAAIVKKNAIPHFTTYLEQKFNATPTEVSVYYTAKATINMESVELYLMKFSMPDGYTSLGITGYFTHLLDKLTMADIDTIYKKFHKQELINLYYAWYLTQEAIKSDPKAQTVNNEKWAEICAQLGVSDAKVVDYITLNKVGYYVHNSTDMPHNPVDKLGKLASTSSIIYENGYNDDVLSKKYPLLFRIFKKNKLVKDNPWGF